MLEGYTVYQIKLVYQSCRAPYEWAPQLDPPEEVGIEPMDPIAFRVPALLSPALEE